MKDKREELYNNLLQSGKVTENEIGSLDDFRSAIKDEAAARKFHKNLLSVFSPDEVGDEDSFYKSISDDFRKDVTSNEKEDSVSAQKDTLPTEADKKQLLNETNAMMTETKQRLEDFNQRVDNMREYGIGLDFGKTKKGKKQFNSETGKFEETFITPVGNRYTNKAVADIESLKYRQTADMSVNGQLRKANMKLAELKAKRAERASEVLEETTKFNKEKLTPLGRALIGGQMHVGMQQADKENSALDVAIRQTEELIKDLEEQKDRENGDDVGFWRGFNRTVGDFRTWDFGMSDLKDAMTMMNADALKGENATEGERDAYNEMIGALYNKELAEQTYGGNADFWNRAGVTTGHMPAFMLDFIATGGGYSGINAVTKIGTKTAAKAIGKQAVEEMAKQGFKSYVKANGMKGLAQEVGSWTIKALGTTADDLLIRAPLMTNTVQAGKTAADIVGRKLGDVVQREDGTLDFANDKTWGSAIWQGEANNIIENYSEMFGAHLDPVMSTGNLAKIASTFGAKRLSGVLSKADAGALGGIMGQTNSLFQKMGVSDYVGEVSEEYYGQLWRTMLNLDDAYQQNPDGTRTNLFKTGQFHGDIWGGMALSMGMMGAGKGVITAANYAGMKHSVNVADTQARELLGDEVWESMRTTLDTTTNDNIGEVAESIVNDKGMSNQEKSAVMNYLERSMNLRGFNLAETASKRGVEADEEKEEANEAWSDGYNITTSPEMQDANNMLELQRTRLAAQLGVAPDELDNEIGDPLTFLREQRELGSSDEDLKAVVDYANAKYVVDGMQQRADDDLDSQIRTSNAMVDARTNRNDSMIHPATMQVDDRKVYILDGNIVLTEDGTMVDRAASDESIIIRDANTGKVEFTSPESILSVSAPINASEEKMAEEQRIRDEFSQKYESDVNGVITEFNAGDPYILTDESGKQFKITITANEQGVVDNGDGTVNVVTETGELAPMAKEDIQKMYDNTNMKRVADYEVQRHVSEQTEEEQPITEEATEETPVNSTPVFAMNDEMVLRDNDGTEKRAIVQGRVRLEDGQFIPDANGSIIEYYVEGEEDMRHSNAESLKNDIVSYQSATAPEETDATEPASEASTEETVAEEAPAPVEEEAPVQEAMPMTKEGDPDYYASTPTRTRSFIYDEAGLDRSEANEHVSAQLDTANKALEKAKKTPLPKMGTSIKQYNEAKVKRQQKIDEAQKVVDFWSQVKNEQNAIVAAERAEHAQRDAEKHDEAVKQVEAEREAQKVAEAERAAVGNENPMPAITEKWNTSKKFDGMQDEIVLPNGERVKGHYVLHESGASSPSHQANNGFHKTEGFPMDESGNTVNDRDYEGDSEAQRVTRDIADNYDQRALQTPVVVSQDGIVLSGNGRTMAGEIAAMNGTDSAYNNYLKQYAAKYGFTPEQVEQMQHPRVAFVPDDYMPYTAETFSKFNQQEMKSQNKTEHAVKLGKTVPDDTFGKIIRNINRFDTLGDFYNDPSAGFDAISELVNAGVIPQAQVAEMVDGEKLSAVGRETLENVLIGKSFEGDPNAVRMLSSVPSMRQSVIFALSEISNNLSLGDDFTLKNELTEAIKLCYEARVQGNAQFGEPVSNFARQLNLFASPEEAQTVADYENATIMMLADVLNDKRVSQLKKVIASYNDMAVDSANGQLDIFSGGIKTKEEILNEVLSLLNNGTKEQIAAAQQAAVERRKESAAETVPENGDGSQGNEVEQISPVEEKDSVQEKVEAAVAETDTNPTPAQIEAGNYKKGHVVIGDFDISIENPAGSERKGVDANGKAWSVTMANTYGYIRGTEGVDGDHIDIFLANDMDQWDGHKVFVVDQTNTNGSFDEHKCMLGFNSIEDAEAAYYANYDPNWKETHPGIRITGVSIDDFNKWIASSHRKTKPFAEYSAIKPTESKKEIAPRMDGYTIEARKDTRDNSDIYAVKFEERVSKDEFKGQKAIAKKFGGYWSNFGKKGFLFKTEDAAQDFAETIMGRTVEEVEEDAPVSIADMQEGPIDYPKEVKPVEEKQQSNETVENKDPYHTDAERAHYKELTKKMRAKLSQLNAGVDPELLQIGVEMAFYHFQGGMRHFADFCKTMIEDCGDAIRPHLKMLYNAASGTEEFIERGWDMEMDDRKTVRNFDVYNFDKQFFEPIDTAKHIVAEAESIQQGEQVIEQIKDKRNEEKLNERKQEETNTAATAIEAVTTASQARSKIEKATTEEQVDEAEKEVDKQIEKVDEQLTVLNYVDNLHSGSQIVLKDGRVVYATIVMHSGEQVSATQFTKPTVERIYATYKGKDLIDFTPDKIDIEATLKLSEEKESKQQEESPIKRPKGWENLKVGDKVIYKGQECTVHDFMEYGEGEPSLDTGMAPVIYEVAAWDEIKPVETKGERPKEKTASKAKTKKEQLNLLQDLFNQNGENYEQKEVQLQSGSGPAEREEGHESRPNESLGESQRHEVEGTDGRGMGRRSELHPLSDNKRSKSVSGRSESKSGIKEQEPRPIKNLHNNVAERGTDYAPKGENARIEANIKAIETMNRLVESGKQATREDMEVMRRFSGWGGLGGAFKERLGKDRWSPENPINKKLREILTPEQYEWARGNASMSQYFTPAAVIDRMWDIARALGFNGGNVLEGSAGIGNILGLMPRDLSAKSNIHAVEVDEAIGQMLALLYPDAKVDIQGFEKTKVANGSVDLSITNVPFVTGLKVFDDSGDADLSKKFRDIHNFCIAKNVRKLREGGIGIFISSNGTLDGSPKLMNWITNEGKSDVVGAFRLNSNTFGGTNATSDIIVVRKRINGKKSANAIDVSQSGVLRIVPYLAKDAKANEKPKDLALTFNQYFIDHPEYMGGEMAFAFEKGETWQETSRRLYPSDDKNQDEMLDNWVKDMQSKDWEASIQLTTPREDTSIIYEDLGDDVKEGTMLLDKDDNLCIAQRGKAVPLNLNANKVKGQTKAQCFKDYKAIKDALNAVLDYQANHSEDKGLEPLLKELNRAYDNFVNTYGRLNKNVSVSFLKNDMEFPSIAALENVTERATKDGKKEVSYAKTDVFQHRVVDMETEPKPTNVKDAIIASIYLNGFVNVPYIAEQLGKSEEDVRTEIIQSGLGFENPITTDIEVSYEYLSGNVREKLAQAKENNTYGKYDVNIKALEKIIPMNIPAHLIEFTLGSSWVNPKLYEDYVKDRTDLTVTLTNAGGTWVMNKPYSVRYEKDKALGIRSEICDKIVYGHELIEAALQNKTVNVTKTIRHYGGETETIVDKEATLACANKIDEIRQDFKDWARKKMQTDPELSQDIERTYNEQFNNYVPKEIDDEFIPEHFGGQSKVVDGESFHLREHQAKAVIRATTQPLMLAHEVGTGKTYTLITTAMEMRRLGTAHKPMIVVQNATVGQFVSSAKALYPNARILTLEDVDRNKEGRKNFYAKIRYNDWDMIVVPQSAFERIPDSPEREARFKQSKIEEKIRVIEQLREASGNDRDPIVKRAEKELEDLKNELNDINVKNQSTKNDLKDEKRKAKAKQNASVKAEEMLDRETDDTMNFDDMGIDGLLIDEAHEYKHLGFETAMQRGVKGVDSSYSKKSQGVYLKTQAVLENNNGRNVVFATGTPISNTAAEIWTFMRYLMPEQMLKDYDIFYFDDFARNFGLIQQTLEFNARGSYKESNRFMGYINLPELVRIWGSIADTVLTKDAGGVSDKIPEMEGGKAQDVFLPQNKSLRSVMLFVKSELDRFDKMSGTEKKKNKNLPLDMFRIAKFAAVDPRLVLEDAPDEPNSKTNETVRQTLKSLDESKKYNGTVAIFCDIHNNKRTGFNLYEDIRKKLIEQGVPAEQIAIMQSETHLSDKKKAEIFDKVNKGEIRVIMGSTSTLGTGVNIQERLHTLIHVDAPTRPMDYTQRNGRILRQGNLHKDWGIPVRILRFGVEDSLDVTVYQRLKTKGAIADSVMNGKQMISDSMNNRVLEEDDDVFGDITAQLSGSQYALLKNQIEKQVKKLEGRRSQYEQDQTYIHNQKPRLKGQIVEAKQRKAIAEAALKKVEASDSKDIVIGNQTFKNVDSMSDYIKDFNSKQHQTQERIRTGYDNKVASTLNMKIGDFDFILNSVTTKEFKRNSTGMITTTSTKMHYTCEELGLIDVPVDGQKLKNALNDIVDDVLSGDDFRERIEVADASIERNQSSLEQLEAREGKPFEEQEALDKALEKLEEYEELMKKELEEKEAKYAEIDKSVDAASDVQSVEEDEDDNSYREVSEKQLLASLREASENGETVKVYRTMQVINGELYSPMAKKVAGKETSPIKFRWEEAEEHPELAKQGDGSKAMPNKDSFYIVIDKGLGKGSLTVAYNPYTHTSRTVLNDQFSSAFIRPNLVIVEVEVPKSELEGIYHAAKAKDSVGEMSWHSGAVSGLLAEMGNPRKVILTRYDKPVRILTKKEEAQMIAKVLEGTDIAIPYNLVTPQVRTELDRLGVEIDENPSGSIGKNADFGKAEYVTDEQIEAMNRKLSDNAISDPKNVRAAAERLAEELNTPVEIIEDVERITSNNPEKQKRMRNSKGWYNTKTGKIYIVLPNNLDVEDVASTVFHEVVAHKGLRELIGEAKYETFLKEVFDHCKADVRKKIAEKAAKHNWDFIKATDEYLGELAEKGFEDFTPGERSLWEKLKDIVLKAIDKFLDTMRLPKNTKLGDNELRYLLWRSYQNLKHGKEDMIQAAQDVVKRNELKLGEYSDAAIYRSGKEKKIMPDTGKQSGETTVATAISSITGTKILKNLDDAIKSYENVTGSHKSRTLIGDLADSLGIHQEDKSSKYATFETANGKTLSIRLSNHNATVSNFDKNGEKEGLSIVIDRNANKGISNDGNAHIIEYFYAEKDLNKADSRALVEIIKSLKQALYSGEYVDKTGLAKREEVNNYNIDDNDGDLLFRTDAETEDVWTDKSLGLHERISAAAARLSNNHANDKILRNDAVKAINSNLSDLRRAMSLQKKFDQSTVKRVGDLARVLINYGYLSGLSQMEVKRLLAAVKNSVGHDDVDASIQKVMDIMVDNQLKNAEATMHQLMLIRASKVDAKGVQVQGKLDVKGQLLMKVMKKAIQMQETDIQESIAEAMNRMSSNDQSVADEAALEYAGLNLALEYVQNITNSKVEEKKLRDELKQSHDEATEQDRATESYKQYVGMVRQAIRQNKIDRAEAYYQIVGKITDSLRDSIENAEAFKEAEKQRIREIQHNANSDMVGRKTDAHRKDSWKDKFMNNSFVSFVFAPMATFDQILRMFGSRSANGEGYLWNRFMRGWVDAREKEIVGVRKKYAELDAKVHEIFGNTAKTMGEAIRFEGKLPKVPVRFWNGGEVKEHELTQGNIMYIYMVNKMLDGRMKLRKMGISEEDVEKLEDILDPRYKELSNWIQEEFLVDTRNEYNETHKRMFGASMAAIENYFPLKILSNARADKAEDLDNPYKVEGISTSTGSIIKRRRNALALDLLGADALDVVLEHVVQMEHWNAYAEWNRDLNTLRTYKHFRNQVQNMTSIYGGGKELWKRFNDLCQMAAGSYRAPRAKLDEAAVNFAKGVSAAKVSFRLFTALKQFLSMPAYLPEARADILAKDIAMPYKAWKWCAENLPIFRERWDSRKSGDPRLMKSDMDWKLWRSRVMEIASRVGMSPNAFVDALTVSIGTHAMYATKLAQYKKDGYSEEDAEKRAKQDATILFNQTQQSSEGVFMSPMQVDRSWLSVLFSVFRNSSMAYTRQLYDAIRNLKRNLDSGNRKETIAFMTKQMVRDGLDEHTAEFAAERKFRKQIVKDAGRVAVFGFIMQLAWNLGAYLPYLLFGDDDDEKDKMWGDVWTHTMFGSIEGLTGGDVLSLAGSMLLSGEFNTTYLNKDMPVTSDLMAVLKKFSSGKHAEGMSDIINLIVQSGIGVNPQSITDGVLAIMDACGDDPELANEAAIFVMRLLGVPQSQIEKIYFDEIGLTGEELSNYTPEQLCNRYAQYKVKRGRFNTPWTWSDADASNWHKIATSNVKERVQGLGDEEVNDAYIRIEEQNVPMSKLYSAFNRAKERKEVKEAKRLMAELQSNPEGYRDFIRFKRLDAKLDKLVEYYLRSKTPEEAALCMNAILTYKGNMVKVLQADSEESREKLQEELSSALSDFGDKYSKMMKDNR